MSTKNRQVIEDALLLLEEGKTMQNIGNTAAIYAARTLLANAIQHHEMLFLHSLKFYGIQPESVIDSTANVLHDKSTDNSDVGSIYTALFLLNAFIKDFEREREVGMRADRLHIQNLANSLSGKLNCT